MLRHYETYELYTFRLYITKLNTNIKKIHIIMSAEETVCDTETEDKTKQCLRRAWGHAPWGYS